MTDQDKIHWKAMNAEVEEGRVAVRQLRSGVVILHDKACIGGHMMKIRYVK